MKHGTPYLMRWKYVAGLLTLLALVVASYAFFAAISTQTKDVPSSHVQMEQSSPTALSSPMSATGVMLPTKPANSVPTSVPAKAPTVKPAISVTVTPTATPTPSPTLTPGVTPAATGSASPYPGMHLLWDEEFTASFQPKARSGREALCLWGSHD